MKLQDPCQLPFFLTRPFASSLLSFIFPFHIFGLLDTCSFATSFEDPPTLLSNFTTAFNNPQTIFLGISCLLPFSKLLNNFIFFHILGLLVLTLVLPKSSDGSFKLHDSLQ